MQKKKLVVVEKNISNQSKAWLHWWSMDGATALEIQFSSTEQGEESKTTLKMKPEAVMGSGNLFRKHLVNRQISSAQNSGNTIRLSVLT